MIIFFSGGVPMPECYLHEPAIMLSYYSHVTPSTNKPGKRFRDILNYKKAKAKAKKRKTS